MHRVFHAMRLLEEYNHKSLGYADSDPSAVTLGKSFFDKYLSHATIGKNIGTTRKNDTHLALPPSPTALIRGSFGQPNANHAFHQPACFKTTYAIVLKRRFFKP
jgi:hypothetical protein